MEITSSTSENNDARVNLRKGMIIYRGKKEINIDAIRKNSSEIMAIDKDEYEFSIHLQNLFDKEQETKKLRELFSHKLESGEIFLIAKDFDDLCKKLSKSESTPPILPSSAIPDHLLLRAKEIINKLDAIDILLGELRKKYKLEGTSKGFRELLEEACVILNSTNMYRYGIHPSTYYEYKNRLKQCHNDVYQLASYLHRTTYKKTRLDKTTQNFVDTIILNYLAGDEYRYTPETVYSKLIQDILERTSNSWINPDKCEKKIPQDLVAELLNPKIPFTAITNNPEKASLLSPVQLPSRSWFYSYFRWFKANPDQTEKEIRERYGDDFYENSILVFDTYVKRAMYPLHYVFVDHCLLDIFIVDEETRSEPHKIWLTVLIDAFSRAILGIALLDQEPSIESVQTALRNAIWPKEDWLEQNDLKVKRPWVCFGYPVNWSMDNAWGHHAASVENLITRLWFKGDFGRIKLLFHPPHKGRYGALIERFFGNIQAQIKELLLGAQKDRQFNSIRNAKREACLLYSDLLQAVVTLINNYMYERHSELDMTPTEKWMEGLEGHYPIVPPLTNEIERFFWRGWHDTRVIHQDGISLFDMKYTSPGLAKAQVVDWDKKKIEYSLSFDPNDISTLAVFLNHKWICDVKATKLQIGSKTWLRMSLTELNLAKRISKERYKTTTKWWECAYEFKELNEKRAKEKKSANRKRENNGKTPSPKASLSIDGNQPTNQSDSENTRILGKFLQKSKRSKSDNEQ